MSKCYDIPLASETLDVLVHEQKQASFTHPDQASDEAALGILIARYFDWDGDAIFKAAQAAFEDSNFHTFNETFEAAWKEQS